MKITDAVFLLNTVHFSASDEMYRELEDQARYILRHHVRPLRVRVKVARETSRHAAPYFLACARLERAGRDVIAHAIAAEPEIAGRVALENLDRAVADKTRRRVCARRHLRAADCGADPSGV